jgi:hypothetical protein
VQGLRQTLPQATPQAIHNAVVMGIGCLGGTKQLKFSQIELFFSFFKRFIIKKLLDSEIFIIFASSIQGAIYTIATREMQECM